MVGHLGLMHWMQVDGSIALRHSPSMWSCALMAVLICVSVSDILWRRVTNLTCLAGWLMGLCMWGQAFGWRGALAALCASVLCFCVGVFMYAFGTIGAADAKVLAAYGAFVGLGASMHLIIYGALFAGALGVVALYRPGLNALNQMVEACFHPVGALQRARKNGQTMPLTVALSGSVFVILWGGW